MPQDRTGRKAITLITTVKHHNLYRASAGDMSGKVSRACSTPIGSRKQVNDELT